MVPAWRVVLVAGCMVASAVAQGPIAKGMYLPNPDGPDARVLLNILLERLEPAKIAPKHPDWIFEWVTSALCDLPGEPRQFELRFRVFAQERREKNDKGERVARMLARLWEFNDLRFGLDHSPQYNSRIVDAYVCYGGDPGGEQLFDEDLTSDGRLVKVNTIYIYALDSFTEPVEMAREVAHEYGHATLPGVGGFTKPEAWANGFLGEKLYLRMLRDEMALKRLDVVDAMGATQASLDTWVKANVDPLVLKAAASGPVEGKLSGKGEDAMDAYMGQVCYVQSVLPEKVFRRSLVLIGSTKAKDYPSGVVLAAEEPDDYVVAIPGLLKGKSLWVPLGKGKLSGAKVLQKRGDWVQVQPQPGVPVRVVNRTG